MVTPQQTNPLDAGALATPIAARPLPRSLTSRVRRWVLLAAGGGALVTWGLPPVQQMLAGDHLTAPISRIPLIAVPAEFAQNYQWVALILLGVAALVWAVDSWASRQRRRLLGQVARMLKVQIHVLSPRVVPGFRAPLRGRVYLPPGFAWDEVKLSVVAEQISVAWGYVYAVSHDQRHDALILRRARRKGLDALNPPEQEKPADPVHARLVELHDEQALPHLTVTSVTPVAWDEDKKPTAFDIVHKSTAYATRPEFQANVGGAITDLVGPVADGRYLRTEWEPHANTVHVELADPMPTLVRHPVIEDYEKFLGTDRLLLPYATGRNRQIMSWDISRRSTGPHALISGPTGGGKTTTIRNLIIEGSRRAQMPWFLIDPKEMELIEFERYPGVMAVATDTETIVLLISLLYREYQERVRCIKRDRLSPEEIPLFGIVIDEFALLSYMLQRATKADKELRKADPLGMLNLLPSVIRAAGGREIYATQRPDASLWGSGMARFNLRTRIALARQDKDADMMMFDRPGVTDRLDRSVPGRAVGTLLTGDPDDAQVWWTPNCDAHPKVRDQLSPDDRALVEALIPPADSISTEMFLPAHEWQELRDLTRGMWRAGGHIINEDGSRPTPPPMSAEMAFLREADDALPAQVLEPGMRILADMDGEAVPAVVVDVEVFDDEVELEIRIEGESRTQTWTCDRGELVPVFTDRDDEE